MKIAIISDLHGNYEALRSLPDDYDELWVLGDLVNYGPLPGAVVDFVRKNSKVVVQGNHDHSLGFDVDPRCSAPFRTMADVTRRYTASALERQQKDFLRSLPLKLELNRENTSFYLCHATPSNPLYSYCLEQSDEWVKEFDQVKADVLLVGHTHIPFIRRIGNKLVVNPGSLGQPKTGKPDACYAVWQDGLFRLQSYPYAVEKTVAQLKAIAFPQEVEDHLITVLRTGSISPSHSEENLCQK
jgi:putative phosphoesterase